MSRHAKKQRPLVQPGAVVAIALLLFSSLSGSQASGSLGAIDLGSAANFAVLAGSEITNTGNTTISGTGADMGSYPTGTFTGPGTVTVPAGATKFLSASPITELAKADLALAYADAVSRVDATTITSGVQTLVPGLYKTEALFALAGGEVLTLDAQGVSNAVFIFQIGSGLTLADSSKVLLTGGAEAKNIFWQVTSTATFAANSVFAGRIMALTSITAAVGASFEGQLLARNGNVTLIGNTITNNSNSSAPTFASANPPTGAATIGSSLTNSITFSGSPAPAVSIAWEYSLDGSSGWSTIADATGSTFSLTSEQLGGYVRTLVTATNSSGEVTQASIATTQILPKAPASPVLETAADTGANSSDGVTSATRPTLSITDLVIGANVLVTATRGDLKETCGATVTHTTESCSITNQLTDGTWSLTAVNTFGGYSSVDSVSLSITVDTTAPVIDTFTVDQASFGTSVLTHSLVFEESVTGLLASDFTVVAAGVSCEDPALSGSGANYSIALADCSGDGDLQLRLAADSAVDLAGNSGPSVAFTTAVAAVDVLAPVVSFVSSATPNGFLTQGDEIPLQIRFSESVVVTGTPRISLETGTTDRIASYVSGSGTNTLIFDYSVQPGDSSADLDYASSTALFLNAGKIADEAGNNAVLTLAIPGVNGSLGANKALVVDGDALRLGFARSSEKSASKSISWTLSAPAALDCTTLSTAKSDDFDFAGLTSIDSISASGDGKTCTITATSSVAAAQFGTSSLTIASSFSVLDSSGTAHTVVTSAETDVLVTIDALSGQGEVSQNEVVGSDPPAQIASVLSQGPLVGTTPADLVSLQESGMVNAEPGVRGGTISINNSKVASSSNPLRSSSQHEVVEGESVLLELGVAEEVAPNHKIAVFVKTGVNSWTFAGSGDFDKTFFSSTDAFSLLAGTYHVKIVVVESTWSINPQSLQSESSGFGGFASFGGSVMPSFSMMSMTEDELDALIAGSNQSHEAEIIVTSSTVPDDPAPADGGSSSGGSGAAGGITEPTPEQTEESIPAVTKEPIPLVTKEPSKEVTGDSEQPGSGYVTDTGGQLPNTDNGDQDWLIPLGIGGSIAVLGVTVFLSRRRLV